ncbi:sensor histidine kinase [Sorangium cellulosum]|uniref:histidine kinase n=1 Tax=Sorangium cellulosum TaxID=56 RepID=A0A2L0ERF0_SORCE|nr:ATP-binding protein [Sorangium cellulosum]AUX41840.1 sensor histidine kinase [Sorangium cellulosum]
MTARCNDLDDRAPAALVREDTTRLYEALLLLAAHEIRTPLTSLLLQLQLTKQMSEREPENTPVWAAAMLAVFDRQLGRLARLCDDMLQVWRSVPGAPAGLRAPHLELVDLAALVREAAAAAVAQRPAARGAIAIAADGVVVGRWDRAQIERMAFHLIKNAITFGEDRPITVEVRATRAHARLVVRDHGMGIAREDQQRIFARFERAVPVERFGGLGLGLYIAHAAARAHGGAIRVESELGRGATFIVDLPLAPRPHHPMRRGRGRGAIRALESRRALARRAPDLRRAEHLLLVDRRPPH